MEKDTKKKKKNSIKDNNKRAIDLIGKSNYIFSLFYFILNFDSIFYFILIIINKKMKYFNNKWLNIILNKDQQ